MRGETAILALVLAVAILAAGCTDSNADRCARLKSQEEIDSCYLSQAEESLSVSTCGKISGQDKAEECISYILDNSMTVDCDSLYNVNYKGYCYSAIDLKLEKESNCGSIADSEIRDQCYYDSAAAGDIESCGMIENKDIKAACADLAGQADG